MKQYCLHLQGGSHCDVSAHTTLIFFVCPWKHIVHVSFCHWTRHFLPWIHVHVLQEINNKINDNFFLTTCYKLVEHINFKKPYLYKHISIWHSCIMFDLLSLYSSKCGNKSFYFHQERNFIIINIIVYHYHYLQSACISFTTPSSHLHALSDFMKGLAVGDDNRGNGIYSH